MITFDDGTAISWEEAAQKIEAEGRLIAHDLVSPEGRCVLGVLGNFTHNDFENNPKVNPDTPNWMTQFNSMVSTNNTFSGTPEERAVYMAGWLRNQEGV